MLAVMLVLGTPFAGPLSVILLVGGLIPYLGVLVSTVAIVLVALGGQGLGPAVLVLAAAVGIEVAITFERSRLEGSSALRVHPAIALIALPIGAVAAGVIGMIVAVPVAAFLQLMTGTALAAFQPRLPRMSSTGTVMPGWLDRLAHWSRGLLVGIGLLGGLLVLAIQLSAPVLAVVLGAVLAATLAPAASALRRRGAGPTAAAFGATVGLVAGISVILILTIVSLARDGSQIVASAGAGSSSVDRCRAGLARVADGPGVEGLRRGARSRGRVRRDLAGPRPGLDPGGDPDVLLPARRRGRLALGDRDARGLAAARGGRSRDPGGRRPRGLHDRDRRHLGIRRGHAVRGHGRAGDPTRPAIGCPVVLRWVHPVHRLVHHHRDRIPRHGRGRHRRRTSP